MLINITKELKYIVLRVTLIILLLYINLVTILLSIELL